MLQAPLSRQSSALQQQPGQLTSRHGSRQLSGVSEVLVGALIRPVARLLWALLDSNAQTCSWGSWLTVLLSRVLDSPSRTRCGAVHVWVRLGCLTSPSANALLCTCTHSYQHGTPSRAAALVGGRG